MQLAHQIKDQNSKSNTYVSDEEGFNFEDERLITETYMIPD